MRHLGKVQAALAFIVSFGFFAVLYFLLIMKEGGAMRDALLIMVGALGAAFGAIVNYYFGSSSGSAQKTALMVNSNGSQDPTA